MEFVCFFIVFSWVPGMWQTINAFYCVKVMFTSYKPSLSLILNFLNFLHFKYTIHCQNVWYFSLRPTDKITRSKVVDLFLFIIYVDNFLSKISRSIRKSLFHSNLTGTALFLCKHSSNFCRQNNFLMFHVSFIIKIKYFLFFILPFLIMVNTQNIKFTILTIFDLITFYLRYYEISFF